MKGSTLKRCGCRDESGKLVGGGCPKLKNARHGSWFYVAELPAHPDGRRRQRRRGGFVTEREAALALAALTEQLRLGDFAEAGDLTVGAWLDEWLAGRVRLQPSSVYANKGAIRLYLKPALGHLRLDRLRMGDIERLYAVMRTLGSDQAVHSELAARLLAARNPTAGPRYPRPLSGATIRRAHAVLHGALNTAVKRRLLTHNPADHIELPAGARIPARVWTPEQVGQFLDACVRDQLGPLFHVIAYCGLRRGEACGLLWTDVDLETGVLRVARQTVQVGPKLFARAPKTRTGARAVALDLATVGVLRAHRARQAAQRLAWGSAYDDTGLVFCKENGAPYLPESVSQRFERLTRRAGLPRIKLHELRHTSASIGLVSGETLKEVSDRLGHSTIAITADIYTHVIPAMAHASAERRAEAIPRAGHVGSRASSPT